MGLHLVGGFAHWTEVIGFGAGLYDAVDSTH
jgi:hypothetical protein